MTSDRRSDREHRRFQPRRNPPSGGRKGRLESRWAVVDGRRMHARVSTELAPPGRIPVVAVHGMVVSSLFMAPLSERLAPDFPVHTPDLPGFGDSEGPRYVLDVRQLADALADWMETVVNR